jgi:predicted membrane protein
MRPHNSKISTLIVGLLFILSGMLLIAFNTGLLPCVYKSIIFSWQTLLIAIGFASLFVRHKRILGLIMILVGGYFMLLKLKIESLTYLQGNGWAAICVIVGICVLCHALGRSRRYPFHHHLERKIAQAHRFKDRCAGAQENGHDYINNKYAGTRETNHDYVNQNCVFGGCKENISSQNFKGGEVNCVFGGAEIDLSGAQLAEGINVLEINMVFGGVTLFIPAHWKIDLRQTQVFGRFEDSRPPANFEVDEKRSLVIVTSSVFGGGEIKSK